MYYNRHIERKDKKRKIKKVIKNRNKKLKSEYNIVSSKNCSDKKFNKKVLKNRNKKLKRNI